MNRQRYMAELSKLLAFMFKEDKEDILAQYNKMLDEAEDEQAMLEGFGSPTKLAVTISRTYKRSERKLSVEADSKNGSDTGDTGVSAVPAAHAAARVKKPEPEPEETLSYADIIEEIRREKALEEGIEYKPIFFNEPEPEVPAAEEEPPAEEAVTEPPAEAEAPAEIEITAEAEMTAEAEAAVEAEPESEQTEELPAEEEASGEAGPDAEEEASEIQEQAGTEAAAEDEAPTEDGLEPEPEPDEASEEAPEEDPEDSAEDGIDAPGNEKPEDESEEIFAELEKAEQPEEEARYKTNAALLVLYLIFAIPVGIVLAAAAAVLGLLLLAFGIGLIAAALKVVGFAFSMFNIFADIMMCAGASLIALAAALIVIWLGLTMLFRAIGGIINGLKALGRSICVREVSVNE